MEYCMEARALKSSLLSPKSTTQQQLFVDDSWCLTNAVTTDDFSVDNFLDFSNQDYFKDTAPSTSPQQSHEEFQDEQHKDNDINSFNSLTSHNSAHFDTLAAAELTLPVDEMENLEWFLHFVDDTVSGLSLSCPVGNFAAGRSEPERRRYTVLDLPNPVQKKKRAKRSRASGKVWSSGLLSLTADSLSMSLSSSQDSNYTYPVHGLESLGSVHKPPAKKARKLNAGESSSSGSQTLRRCSHCLVQKTPQWRTGPLGAKTLCNACGVRFKSGRLFPEYRPACSPTFFGDIHSNSHRKVVEMRRKKETVGNVETRFRVFKVLG